MEDELQDAAGFRKGTFIFIMKKAWEALCYIKCILLGLN